MPISNTRSSYGTVAKTFHWLIALLIVTALPLGGIATRLAHGLGESGAPDAALVAMLYSLHKTVGVTIFLVALARIAWAIAQPRPGLINGHRRVESLAAATVHWLLYGSLVAIPLTGWVHHAATSGGAPILWPFGQNLPLVPESQIVSNVARGLHHALIPVLVVSVAAHVLGALKHHFLDRDATLLRMLPGRTTAEPSMRQPRRLPPLAAALAIWAAVIGYGLSTGQIGGHGGHSHDAAERAAPGGAALAATTGWEVRDGTLSITILQMGDSVTGTFADWSARIDHADAPDADGRTGSVRVDVDVASLSLGSMTGTALGADYLDAAGFPRAIFEADLFLEDAARTARGSLTLKGREAPVALPFTLETQGDSATAAGRVTVDRRDFGIGGHNQDSVGFAVDIAFELTARRL